MLPNNCLSDDDHGKVYFVFLMRLGVIEKKRVVDF